MFLVPADTINSKGQIKVRKFYDQRSHRVLNSYFLNGELSFAVWEKSPSERVFYAAPKNRQPADREPGIPFGSSHYLARLVFYDSCPRGKPVKMYYKRRYLDEFENEEQAVEIIKAYAQF